MSHQEVLFEQNIQTIIDPKNLRIMVRNLQKEKHFLDSVCIKHRGLELDRKHHCWDPTCFIVSYNGLGPRGLGPGGFGFWGIPLSNSPFHKAILGIQTTGAPNHQLTISWLRAWEKKTLQSPFWESNPQKFWASILASWWTTHSKKICASQKWVISPRIRVSIKMFETTQLGNVLSELKSVHLFLPIGGIYKSCSHAERKTTPPLLQPQKKNFHELPQPRKCFPATCCLRGGGLEKKRFQSKSGRLCFR